MSNRLTTGCRTWQFARVGSSVTESHRFGALQFKWSGLGGRLGLGSSSHVCSSGLRGAGRFRQPFIWLIGRLAAVAAQLPWLRGQLRCRRRLWRRGFCCRGTRPSHDPNRASRTAQPDAQADMITAATTIQAKNGGAQYLRSIPVGSSPQMESPTIRQSQADNQLLIYF